MWQLVLSGEIISLSDVFCFQVNIFWGVTIQTYYAHLRVLGKYLFLTLLIESEINNVEETYLFLYPFRVFGWA